jgi:hypothetical protein
MCISDSRFFNAILFYHTASNTLPPDMFAKVVYGCYTKDNIDASAYAPLATAARRFLWSPPNLRYQWKPIIRHLISLEADLHQGSDKDKGITILDDLMGWVDSPFESRSVGQAWLDVLTDSGIDVVKHLQTEYQLHFDPSTSLPMMHKRPEYDFRRQYLIISLETPSISWDWFIDPEGQAHDVLEEFKNLGSFSYLYDYRRHRLNFHWPIVYSRWQRFVEGILSPLYKKKKEIIFVHRANDRFKRRCEKKATKLTKAQGIYHRGHKIPGAWIE